MIVVPASQKIYLNALRQGYIETLIQAGAIVESSSCASCMGLHTGVLPSGEVAISTTNRNYKGRMGSPSSFVYLASPATAAAAAIEGHITDPRKYLK
jgi:3-isopropylmalate/(R)-2-methylmalate dehydratase large subunit